MSDDPPYVVMKLGVVPESFFRERAEPSQVVLYERHVNRDVLLTDRSITSFSDGSRIVNSDQLSTRFIYIYLYTGPDHLNPLDLIRDEDFEEEHRDKFDKITKFKKDEFISAIEDQSYRREMIQKFLD